MFIEYKRIIVMPSTCGMYLSFVSSAWQAAEVKQSSATLWSVLMGVMLYGPIYDCLCPYCSRLPFLPLKATRSIILKIVRWPFLANICSLTSTTKAPLWCHSCKSCHSVKLGSCWALVLSLVWLLTTHTLKSKLTLTVTRNMHCFLVTQSKLPKFLWLYKRWSY